MCEDWDVEFGWSSGADTAKRVEVPANDEV
jgi:hypothetical protein